VGAAVDTIRGRRRVSPGAPSMAATCSRRRYPKQRVSNVAHAKAANNVCWRSHETALLLYSENSPGRSLRQGERIMAQTPR
jgi:hypothetical protein